MMEPTPLPRARPALPMNAAMTETTASGVVVPRETIVAPIISLDRPVLLANSTTPSTNQSAPFETTTRQTTIIKTKSRVGHTGRI